MTITRKLTLTFGVIIAAQVLISLLALWQMPVGVLWAARGLALLFTILLSAFTLRGISQSLGGIVQEITGGAEQLASAAAQISVSSTSLAEGTSQQAASLQDTSSSADEIHSMAQRNSENSYSAAELVKQSDQKFADVDRFLRDMVSAMAEINTSSDKISKIIKVIDEIAFQTNILALNAAVEAARAGEAGMGFAVVADEVRNLAQRCAQAARDTAILIEESISKSSDGKLKVDQVAKAIQRVTEQSAQIKILVDEVHLGSQEQSRGIDQIAKSIVQMEHLTQKAGASAEESASTAEQLRAQSSSLKNVVLRLNSTIVRTGSTLEKKRAATRPPNLQSPHASNKLRRITHEAMGSTITALHKTVSNDFFEKPSPMVAAEVAEKDPLPMDENFQAF